MDNGLDAGSDFTITFTERLSSHLTDKRKNPIYVAVILSELRDWERILPRLCLRISGYVCNPLVGVPIDFYQLLPLSFSDFDGNFLFLVDSIKEIGNAPDNLNWIKHRKIHKDLMMDADGSVLELGQLIADKE